MRNIRKIISGILVLAVASTVFFTPSEGRDALAAEDTVEKTDQKEAFPENAATGKETPDNVVEDEIIIVYEDAGVSKKKSESIQEAARDAQVWKQKRRSPYKYWAAAISLYCVTDYFGAKLKNINNEVIFVFAGVSDICYRVPGQKPYGMHQELRHSR